MTVTDHTPRICPACRAPLPGGAVAGMCPRCVLRVSVDAPADSAAPLHLLGEYALFEEIARGGMGVVYRARQRRLDREVAVKILRGGEFAGAEAQARFRAEATAVARLRHPGIVAIHDVGEEDGVLWFSMDLVPGDNLAQRVREHPMAAREAAQCVQRVAGAVQHAHENGVLHRDLKPSNILLDAAGHPQIADFGIARRMDTDTTSGFSDLTRTGQILGSPGYAAPEQALGGTADVRTDVYGLGALLYHLLTGRPPFQGPTLDSILLQLRENEPIAPRRLNPTVPRDLEVICLQALRKDAARRYATARAFGEDLARFLDGGPIRARPVGPLGRVVRWARHRPRVATLVALVIALAGTLIIGSIAFARRQSRQEHRAALIAGARGERLEGIAGSRTRALAALREAWRIQPSAEVRNEIIATLSVPEIARERSLGPGEFPARPSPPGASADGRRAVRLEGGQLIVSERASAREIARLAGFADAHLFQLDETGRRLAVARADAPDITLHEIPGGKLLRTLAHPQAVMCLDWSGEFLAAGCLDRFVHVWDSSTGERRQRFSGHDDFPIAVRFRPHGQELISVARDRNVRLWHAGRGVPLLHADGRENHGADAWWADAKGTLLVCEHASGFGAEVYRFGWPRSVSVFGPGDDEPHSENIGTLSLDARGGMLATVDERSCRIWTRSGIQLTAFPKDRNEWFGIVLANDGVSFWLSGWNTGVRRFAIDRADDALPNFTPTLPLIAIPKGPLLVAQRADGRAFAFTDNHEGDADDALWIQIAETEDAVRLPQPSPFSAALSPDGRWAVTGSFQRSGATLWSLPDGKLVQRIEFPECALAVSFSGDGKWLWLVGGQHVTRLHTGSWQPDGVALPQEKLPGFALSPDNRFVACLARNEVRLRHAHDLREIVRLAIPAFAGWPGDAVLAFSADARTLAAHTALGSVIVWDLPELTAELREMGMAW